MHEWKDYISQAEIDAVKDDPLFKAYAAGFSKAHELYGRSPQISNIIPPSNPIDYYLWWKESENGNP